MVQCRDGTLYTGYTNNIPKRITAHNAGKGGHYTRAHRPVILVATWAFTTKGGAEWQIKHVSRDQKLRLVEGISEEEMSPISMNKDGVAHED